MFAGVRSKCRITYLACGLVVVVMTLGFTSVAQAFDSADGSSANSRTLVVSTSQSELLKDSASTMPAATSPELSEQIAATLVATQSLLARPEAAVVATIAAVLLSAMLGGAVRGRHESERQDLLKAKVERHRQYRQKREQKLQIDQAYEWNKREPVPPLVTEKVPRPSQRENSAQESGLLKHREPKVVTEATADQVNTPDQSRSPVQDPHFAQISAASNVVPFERPRRNDEEVKRSIRDKTRNYKPPVEEDSGYIVVDGTDDTQLYMDLDLPDLSKIQLDDD